MHELLQRRSQCSSGDGRGNDVIDDDDGGLDVERWKGSERVESKQMHSVKLSLLTLAFPKLQQS
jgi:hypothetical protein